MNPISCQLDKVAIALSIACAVHCLMLPVALVVLPALAVSGFGDEHLHQWMLLVVLPASLIALTMGCRNHRRWSVFALTLPGLALLTFAALFGHALLGESWEKIASLLGSLLISLGHFRNYSLCKQLRCDC